MTQLNSVVLPAPFGPIRPQISPAFTSTGHAVERAHAAEAHRHVVDAKQRASRRAATSSRARSRSCSAICADVWRHCFAPMRAVQRESDCRHCDVRTLHCIQVALHRGRGARRRGPTRASCDALCGLAMHARRDRSALVRCPTRRVALPESRGSLSAGRPNCGERNTPWRACRIRSRRTCRSRAARSTSAWCASAAAGTSGSRSPTRPKVLEGVMAMAGALRNETVFEKRFRELGIVMVGLVTRSAYEFDHHWNAALAGRRAARAAREPRAVRDIAALRRQGARRAALRQGGDRDRRGQRLPPGSALRAPFRHAAGDGSRA